MYFHHLHEESTEDLKGKALVMRRQGFLAAYSQLVVGLRGHVSRDPHPLPWSDVKSFLYDYCGLPDETALDSKHHHMLRQQFHHDVGRLMLSLKPVIAPLTTRLKHRR